MYVNCACISLVWLKNKNKIPLIICFFFRFNAFPNYNEKHKDY